MRTTATGNERLDLIAAKYEDLGVVRDNALLVEDFDTYHWVKALMANLLIEAKGISASLGDS